MTGEEEQAHKGNSTAKSGAPGVYEKKKKAQTRLAAVNNVAMGRRMVAPGFRVRRMEEVALNDQAPETAGGGKDSGDEDPRSIRLRCFLEILRPGGMRSELPIRARRENWRDGSGEKGGKEKKKELTEGGECETNRD